MTLKREIKDAYLEGGNPIYVKTHSNAVYVDENETETLTGTIKELKELINTKGGEIQTVVADVNNNKTKIAEHTTQLNETTNEIELVKTNYAKKTEINSLVTSKAEKTEVQALDSKISKIASGSPKAVSTISEMTDTTKNYVLTTDGNWYYHNGSTWVSGGVYQSTGLGEKSIISDNIAYNFIACTGSNTVSIDWGLNTVFLNQTDLAIDNTKIRIIDQTVSIPSDKNGLLFLYALRNDTTAYIAKNTDIPSGAYVFLGLNTWTKSIIYNPNENCIKKISNDGVLLQDTFINTNIKNNKFLHEYCVFPSEKCCTIDFINKTFSINKKTNIITKNNIITTSKDSYSISLEGDVNSKLIIVYDLSDLEFKIKKSGELIYDCICVAMYQINESGIYSLVYCKEKNNFTIINYPTLSDGTELVDMNFNLKSIKTDRNMFLEEYTEDFTVDYGSFEILKENIDGDVSNEITNKKYVIKNLSSGATNTSITNTIFDCNVSSKCIEVSLDKCEGSFLIGARKDENNYILFKQNYSRTVGEFRFRINGSTAKGYSSGIIVEPPCKLQFQFNNNFAFAYAIKDGEYKIAGVIDLKSNNTPIDFDIQSEPKDWKFSFGCEFENKAVDSSCVIDNIKVGYSSGACIGADFKVVKYKNGEPYIENGENIFITATSHSSDGVSGCGGINIYKLNFKNYKIEFTGKILDTIIDDNFPEGNGKISSDSSCSILYDKNTGIWYISTSSFGLGFDDTRILIGSTYEKPLYGVNIIKMQKLKASPENDSSMWDFDFVYVPSENKYYGAIRKGWVYKTDDPLGTWEKVKDVTGGFEGCACTKVNGKYLFTTATESSNETLAVNNLMDGENIGTLNFNVYPKTDNSKYKYSTPTWGSVIPIYYGGRTHYYCILFSLRNFESKRFTYGDMWIYKASQSSNGSEF